MDVYDEVDRRENDAGERGWGWLLGVPPRLGAGGRPGAGRSRARRSPRSDPHRTAGPSFLIPRAGAGGRFLQRGAAVPDRGAGRWRWVPGPPLGLGMSLVGTARPRVGVEGGSPFPWWVGRIGLAELYPSLRWGHPEGAWGSPLCRGPPQGTLWGWGRSFPPALLGSAPSPARWPRARACVLPAPQPAGGGGTAPPGPQPIGVGAPPTLPLPAVWLTTQNHSTLVTERSAVPFLPVNPEYSATRNQVSPARRSDPPSHAWTPPHCFYPPAIPGPAEVGQVQRPGVCHSAHRYPGGSQAPAAGEEPAQPHG